MRIVSAAAHGSRSDGDFIVVEWSGETVWENSDENELVKSESDRKEKFFSDGWVYSTQCPIMCIQAVQKCFG